MQKDFKAKLAISIAAILAIGAMLYGSRERALAGINDFIPLYAGAMFVGTDSLYEIQPYMDFQTERFGAAAESLRYTRPPFYALLLTPLRLFDYQTAYGVWSLFRVGAIVAFILLWPAAKSKVDTFLFVSLSMPIYMALMTGQDSLLLLPLIALGLRLEKSRPFVAGFALSLCAIKYHLFTLVPVLLLAQRRWDIGKGFLAGVAALTALSFAGGGWSWPAQYLGTLLDGRVHPEADRMPNLHGLGMPLTLELALCALIAAAAWLAMRRLPFDVGLATALTGGVLLSYHCYVMDCVILVPALMVVLLRAETDWLRLSAVIFLSPLPPLLLLTGPPKSYFMHAGLLVLLGALLYRGLRREAAAEAQPDYAEA